MNWDFFDDRTITVTSAVFFFAECCGVLSAVHALRRVRTAQATTAWCVGLVTLPLLVVPGYWIFGRSRFFGYREALRRVKSQHAGPAKEYERMLRRVIDPHERTGSPLHELAKVVDQPVTHGNELGLLIDGHETFEAMFGAIRQAQEYVLVQFFIIENDFIGNDFAETLIERAQAGVRVFLLYDDIGCQWLPQYYLDRLSQAGVEVSSFSTRGGFRRRLQVNFRNHRKVVIVDGKVAFTGGFNVGDEYLDGGRRFRSWRDTHISVRGPAVQAVQAAFNSDWFWARRELIENLLWQPGEQQATEQLESPAETRSDNNCSDNYRPDNYCSDESSPAGPAGQVVVIPTGPADTMQRCTMMYCQLAAMAKRRIWISTPYFVPNEAVATALETAAARGVEVRVLIPGKPDHLIVYLAGNYHEDGLLDVGIDFHRYREGFMHQKAVLVDDTIAAVGSTNLDNRSLHLNFEIMVAGSDPGFIQGVDAMLQRDFRRSDKTQKNTLSNRPFWFQIIVGVSRLFSPIL